MWKLEIRNFTVYQILKANEMQSRDGHFKNNNNKNHQFFFFLKPNPRKNNNNMNTDSNHRNAACRFVRRSTKLAVGSLKWVVVLFCLFPSISSVLITEERAIIEKTNTTNKEKIYLYELIFLTILERIAKRRRLALTTKHWRWQRAEIIILEQKKRTQYGRKIQQIFITELSVVTPWSQKAAISTYLRNLTFFRRSFSF